MRIVMAGASGFLGTRLRARLAADGHELSLLVRRAPSDEAEVRWEPGSGLLDPAVLAGADAVVNVAGVDPSKRWTERNRRKIRSSRIDTATTIATTLAKLPEQQRPRVFLQQSGTAGYGDAGDAPVTEDTPATAPGFLAETGRLWEGATGPAEEAGVRVVLMRTAPVVDREGLFLKVQLPVFRLGLGGKIAGGRHWVSWISLDDWLDAVVFLLRRDDISGPVNLVAPPVTNAHFTKALAAAVHRPAIFPIPGFAIRLMYDGFGAEALKSQRVMPGVLREAGYEFRHPTIEQALRAALSGSDRAAR